MERRERLLPTLCCIRWKYQTFRSLKLQQKKQQRRKIIFWNVSFLRRFLQNNSTHSIKTLDSSVRSCNILLLQKNHPPREGLNISLRNNVACFEYGFRYVFTVRHSNFIISEVKRLIPPIRWSDLPYLWFTKSELEKGLRRRSSGWNRISQKAFAWKSNQLNDKWEMRISWHDWSRHRSLSELLFLFIGVKIFFSFLAHFHFSF